MKILKQAAIIFGVCLIGEIVSELIPVPFPGSVISMVFLFILFILNWFKPGKLKEVNGFLLDNMGFFFIPPGVGIMTQFEILKSSAVQILIVCIVSTVVTFAATAYTVKFVMLLQNKFRQRKEAKSGAGID